MASNNAELWIVMIEGLPVAKQRIYGLSTVTQQLAVLRRFFYPIRWPHSPLFLRTPQVAVQETRSHIFTIDNKSGDS